MGNTVIIAEKPSVASGIAKIVGATTPHRDKANGYLEGNGYQVTWAFGHLVGLDRPEEYGFSNNELPMFPEEWKTHVIEYQKADVTKMTKKQVEIINTLFSSASRIIVATDAGREGELIFRYIYEYLGCRTPFVRLWISSLTDEAIRQGMRDLQPGGCFDSLSEAAHARSEADWLVGFNASRALRLTSGYKGNLSLGRVQTPVLCMICERFEVNRNFVPTPFWQLRAIVHKEMSNFTVLSAAKFSSEADAAAALARVDASKKMRITKVERKQLTNRPPLLYDLTALQRAANSKFGLTAAQTLSAAQSLYEKKYLSYPRTGSRYISDDVFRTIPSLIQKAQGCERFSDAAAALSGKRLCKKSVDGSKVTDHHALLPTEVFPSDLSGNEKLIWEMVCGRMLEAFGEDSISERTSVELDCNGILFKASGSVMLKPGWKSVFGVSDTDDDKPKDGKGDTDRDESDNGRLPALLEGEILPAAKTESVRKTDKPLPIYTDASLLGEMETCGKKIDDEELRESMKDVGLGTPATRAGIIELLINRGYIVRSSNKLTPTDLGNDIWKTVHGRKIADVRTTGEWERELNLIEQGKKGKDEFDAKIKKYVLEIIDDLREHCQTFSSATAAPILCPLCGRPMAPLKFSLLCDAEKGGCGFKINYEVAGKTLPATAVKALAQGKPTALIKGFKSKSGKTFDARLAIDRASRKLSFVFDDAPVVHAEGKICPCCGRTLSDDKWKLNCGCGFSLSKSVGGIALDEKKIDTLLSGGKVLLNGMKNKAGKIYSAKISIDRENKKLFYDFVKTKK